ncbi:FISUMP domain-containing protein [Chitinophaga niabensis]|uniref:Major paralogous domain-containing protein/Por secretion system C-terminal sorting domain-containing protein n=1 Tax=Chitinophaga niabensis TaxID=536979 RepID=A0A1N6G768_9BACT|nr:FISUMP domain-containing protein [Chitinophaga niabensis]SIO03396.1 major paralogous domain-containing protein/Por secretion system C-terminal sorting domain-containing protein [Chitinophaga niabensis]
MPTTYLLRLTSLLLLVAQTALSQTAPPKPVLHWPLNQAQGYTDFLLDLRWTAAPANNIVYDVYIGTDPAQLRVFAENAVADFANDSCVVYQVEDTFHLLAFYPPDQLSTLYWKIVAKDNAGGSTASDVWSFTMGRQNMYPPDAPTQPVPANNAVNISRSPLLQWTGGTDPDGDTPVYDLYLSTNSQPAATDCIATGLAGTSFQVNTPTKGNTTYYWKVVAKDPGGLESYSNVWKFATMNTPPPVVTQSFPAHQAVDVDYNLSLTWEKAIDEDNDTVRYELWYGTGAVPDRMQATNDLSVALNLPANTTYNWKVVAIDTKGGRSESGIHTFTTKNNTGNTSPASPQLLSPLNNSTGILFQQTMQWNAAADPDSDPVKYIVYMGTTQSNMMAVSTGLTNTSFLPPVLSGKTYYWKVAAYDGKGGVTESSIWQFATTTDDPGLTNFRFYYRFSDPTQIYRYDPATLSPAFDLNTFDYTAIGRTIFKDAVALVLDYSDPSTVVSFDLPSSLTVTEGITYNYGLPFGATKYYMISGTFATSNIITVHLQAGVAKRSYTINAKINVKPTRPMLLEPANSAGNVSITPELKWTDGDDPDGGAVTYRVYLGVSSNQLTPRGFTNTKSYPITPALSGSQRYYWKVIAYDPQGESTESDIHTFVTEKIVTPTVPSLEYPREISVYVETDVTLAWSYVNDPAITYDVYLDTKSTPDRIAQGITGKTYRISNLLPNTTYYWKVVARDQQGGTISSTIRKFLTKPLNGNETGTFTDTRDGQIYQWIRLNGEKWMVHNLAYQPDAKDGYYGYDVWNEISRDKNYAALNNNNANISKYGYLYTWAAAMDFDNLPDTARNIRGVCPCGWHVPAIEDWDKLYPLTNNKPAMMHYSTWSYSGKENEWLNSSGFSWLPSGFFNGFSGQFETNANQVWIAQRDRKVTNQRGISYSQQNNFYFSTNNNIYGAASVRCVKNTADNRPPAVPLLQSPLNNSQHVPFNGQLQWNAATDPDNGDIVVYDLYIDTVEVPVKLVQQGISATTYQLSELEPGKKYYWSVRARDTSGEIAESAVWSFTSQVNTTNTAPPAPQLIAPAHQSTATGAFQWTAVTDPDGDAVVYHFYIGVQRANLQLTARDLNTTSYQVNDLIAGITYYWKVVATDAHGGRSESTVGEFTTLNHPPAVPVLLAPVDGVEGVPLQQDLSWTAVTDPDGDKVYYKLMFGTSPAMLGEWSTDPTATRYAIPWSYLQTNTVYYWKVIATDGKGGEAETAVRSFKTNGGPAAGDVPVLISPLNWAVNIDANPLLKWTKPGDNLRYDLYVGVESMSLSLVANDITDTSFVVTQLYGANKLKPHSIYFWKVIAKANNNSTLIRESAVCRFTTQNNLPSKPILTNPSASAPSTLRWTAATDPDNDILVYDVYFGTAPDPAATIATDLQLLQHTIAALAPGTYYWKVVVKDAYGGSTSSDISSFTVQPPVPNTPPAAPVLVTPENGKRLSAASALLTWNAAQDAENDVLVYDVYLDKGRQPVTKVAQSLTGLSFTASPIENNSVYYWKVIARDPSGGEGISQVFSFTGLNEAPSIPVLQTPVNNSDINTATATLTWSSSTDADSGPVEYDVYFGTTLQKAATVSTNTFTTPTLTANTTYYWKVVARDPQQATAESAVWSFTYKVPVVNQPPAAPQLVTPADQSKIAATQPVVFTWTAATDPENGPVTYDLYLSDVKVAEGLTTLSYTHTLAAGIYTWKVVAKDDHNNNTTSAARSFTTVNAFTISGKVTYATGRGLPDILLSSLVKTDNNGNYSVSVPAGWSGTFKPVFWSYEFEPKEMVYTNVLADFSAQDYVVKVITAVNDPVLDSLVKVQPNPTSGPVEIILPISLHTWQLEVHDIKGVLVHQQKIAGNAGRLQVRIPGKGVFLLRLSHQQKTIVRKIIVL